MRYVLSCPELSCVIPGMANLGQVDMNVIYSDGAGFPQGLKTALAPHCWQRNSCQQAAKKDCRKGLPKKIA